MLFSGDGARAFARLIPGCDNRVIYAEHFYMPNNIYNFLLFPIHEKEFERKTRATDKRLEQVCHHIQNGTIKRRGGNSFSSVLGKIQNIAFPKIEEKGKGSFVADRDCIHCGMCVKHCPLPNAQFRIRRLSVDAKKQLYSLLPLCKYMSTKSGNSIFTRKTPQTISKTYLVEETNKCLRLG